MEAEVNFSKVKRLQSWMTIKKTEISAQHEFLKPIYLCVYRVTILKYLGVQEKCKHMFLNAGVS